MKISKIEKAAIRADKIRIRDLKPHYSHLSLAQKKLVKALEMEKIVLKEMTIVERFDKNWRATESGQQLLIRYSDAVNALKRARNKLDLSENEEQQLLNSTTKSRFANSSF